MISCANTVIKYVIVSLYRNSFKALIFQPISRPLTKIKHTRRDFFFINRFYELRDWTKLKKTNHVNWNGRKLFAQTHISHFLKENFNWFLHPTDLTDSHLFHLVRIYTTPSVLNGNSRRRYELMENVFPTFPGSESLKLIRCRHDAWAKVQENFKNFKINENAPNNFLLAGKAGKISKNPYGSVLLSSESLCIYVIRFLD